jgi:alpha-L-arabinofuranosidase
VKFVEDKDICKITLDVNDRGIKISPVLYGIFFEDINYAGDGGMYPELINNRSFEYFDINNVVDKRLMAWEKIQSEDSEVELAVLNETPINQINPNYLNIRVTKQGTKMGVRNLGFHSTGFYIKEGESYSFSLYARSPQVGKNINISLQSAGSTEICGQTQITIIDLEWKQYKTMITAANTYEDVNLVITLDGIESLDLDFVSLFPVNTFNKRENGLRPDMVQMLKDLNPKFLRFPGGCIVEGRSFENMYRWKETIGPVEERKTNWNRWQLPEYQKEGRKSEDYFQSYGLGFYEYFLLCEDIGATPLAILNVGMTCQWHESLLVPLDELDPFIQDILDLIEFANGDETTEWGRKRIELGHPAPFNLEYIGVGNEQWGPQYFERYEIFHKAIKKRYPDINLITSAGWTSEGKDFDFSQQWMKTTEVKAELIDEHFYKKPEWFLNNVNRYDNYDRSLPKVFAGEYAAHVKDGKNNWEGAMVEAAFLTGVEKNADHVWMACYAPLFGKTGHNQWHPNLIWFDNSRIYGTPSYYVQQLFSQNVGDRIIDTVIEGNVEEPPNQLHVVANLDEKENAIIIKAVNLSPNPQKLVIKINTDREISDTATEIILSSDKLSDENSYEEPTKVAPVVHSMNGVSREFLYEFSKYSVTILKLKLV